MFCLSLCNLFCYLFSIVLVCELPAASSTRWYWILRAQLILLSARREPTTFEPLVLIRRFPGQTSAAGAKMDFIRKLQMRQLRPSSGNRSNKKWMKSMRLWNHKHQIPLSWWGHKTILKGEKIEDLLQWPRRRFKGGREQRKPYLMELIYSIYLDKLDLFKSLPLVHLVKSTKSNSPEF